MNRNPLIPLCICHIMLYHGTSTSVMCICRQQHVNRSVLVEGKKYDKIQVVGDGQCFFRCLVAFGWQDIRCANRNEIGSPLDINIAVRETALAERLRTKTVEFLSMHKYDLNILCGKLPFLLDSKLGQSYSGIEDRLSSMISNSEYTGFLEMAAVSYITGHEIRVFHESKKQRTIELYTSLSSVNSSKSNSLLHIPVTLLYQVDDCRGAGLLSIGLYRRSFTTDFFISVTKMIDRWIHRRNRRGIRVPQFFTVRGTVPPLFQV
jgi:hypothetical protein